MKQPVNFLSLAAGFRLVCFLTFFIAMAGSHGGASQVRVDPDNSPPNPGERTNPATVLGPPREEPNPKFNLWGGESARMAREKWVEMWGDAASTFARQ